MSDNYPSFDEHFRRFDRPRNAARNDLALGEPIRPEYATNSVYLAERYRLLRQQAETDLESPPTQPRSYPISSDQRLYLFFLQQATQNAAKRSPKP